MSSAITWKNKSVPVQTELGHTSIDAIEGEFGPWIITLYKHYKHPYYPNPFCSYKAETKNYSMSGHYGPDKTEKEVLDKVIAHATKIQVIKILRLVKKDEWGDQYYPMRKL